MHFITFSRKMGTSGSEIAQRVADQLGYKFHDTDAIENVARERIEEILKGVRGVQSIDNKILIVSTRS